MRLPLTFIFLIIKLANFTVLAYPGGSHVLSSSRLGDIGSLKRRAFGDIARNIGEETSGSRAFKSGSSLLGDSFRSEDYHGQNVDLTHSGSLSGFGDEERSKVAFGTDHETAGTHPGSIHEQAYWSNPTYVAEWKSWGLDPHDVAQFGYEMGVRDDKVVRITADSFDRFNELKPSNSEVLPGEYILKIQRWYKTEFFHSLSPRDQEMLNYNVDILDGGWRKRPWWTDSNMATWENRGQDPETMIKIGNILDLNDDLPLKPKKIHHFRADILRILVDNAAKNDIEESVGSIGTVARGDFAQALRQATLYDRSQVFRGMISHFDTKFKALKPTPEELQKIRIFLDSGSKIKMEPEISNVYYLQVLMNGIPIDVARDYAKSVNFVKSNWFKVLMSDDEKAISAVRGMQPANDGGKIVHGTTYVSLENVYREMYGFRAFTLAKIKSELSVQLKLAASKFKGFRSWLGGFLKRK